MKLNRILFIAHRGESFEAPENSLSSICLAWGNGAKAVEIDVQLTADNHIVVIHDENTLRIGDKNKTIKKTNLDELKKIDIGSFKGEKWKNERIPTLKEVLDTIPENGKLIIEIKSDEKIIEPLITLIKNANLKTNQVEIIAFNFKLLAEIKKLIPEYRILWLLGSGFYWSQWHIMKKKIKNKLLIHNLDGVNVYEKNLINKKIVSYFQKNGLSIYAWTVNDPAKALKLVKSGINGITSDKPTWLKNKITNF